MFEKKPEFREVRVVVVQNILDGLEGNIDDAIKKLKSLKKTYEGGYKTLFLEETTEYDYGDEYTHLTLYGTRDETEKEKEERLNKDKKKKEVQEARERKELKKLQEKYNK